MSIWLCSKAVIPIWGFRVRVVKFHVISNAFQNLYRCRRVCWRRDWDWWIRSTPSKHFWLCDKSSILSLLPNISGFNHYKTHTLSCALPTQKEIHCFFRSLVYWRSEAICFPVSTGLRSRSINLTSSSFFSKSHSHLVLYSLRPVAKFRPSSMSGLMLPLGLMKLNALR